MISLISLLALIPAEILGAYGSIYLKKGADRFSLDLLELYRNKVLMLGAFLSGMSLIFYTAALSFSDLSVVYPLSSITYVLIALLSVSHLKERMNSLKWLGITFIIIGSFLIVR